jgi:hypothetical protein
MRRTLAAAVIALTLIACGTAPDNKAVPADVAADAGLASAPPAAKKQPGTVDSGTWKVGAEVKPGTYLATAETHCYWARLRNFDGELTSIIANGNLEPGQRGRLTVKSTDKGLEVNGDCLWVLDRK